MSDKQGLLGKHIVVVEDEPLIKTAVETILSDAGAIIARAFDQKLDGAILDVRLGNGISSMPIAIGLELRGIPFLFCTGYGDVVGPVIKRRWPRCTILSKPISADALIDGITSMWEPQMNRIAGRSTKVAII